MRVWHGEARAGDDGGNLCVGDRGGPRGGIAGAAGYTVGMSACLEIYAWFRDR